MLSSTSSLGVNRFDVHVTITGMCARRAAMRGYTRGVAKLSHTLVSALEAAAVVRHDETVFAIDPEREVIFSINY